MKIKCESCNGTGMLGPCGSMVGCKWCNNCKGTGFSLLANVWPETPRHEKISFAGTISSTDRWHQSGRTKGEQTSYCENCSEAFLTNDDEQAYCPECLSETHTADVSYTDAQGKFHNKVYRWHPDESTPSELQFMAETAENEGWLTVHINFRW